MNLAELAPPLPPAGVEPDDAFAQAFAAGMRRLHVAAGGSPALAETVAQIAARAGAAILEGQTYVDLRAVEGFDREQLAQALAQGPAIAPAQQDAPPRTPLVASGSRVYLARYWEYQRSFDARLARLNRPADDVDAGALRKRLDQHFRDSRARPNWQKVAAATAALRHLCVISGGPGTGKTSTVVKILAILLTLKPELKVAIAAPTGKAAARVQESIRQQMAGLELPANVAEAMPREPHTIHRLLGVRHGEVGFRHNEQNPLPYDVVVVDEASMLDLALAAKLVAALREDARLILLGDKDQLSSVEAGAVYAGISAQRTMTRSWRAHVADFTRETLPTLPDDETSLRNAVVWLEHSYRFGAESPLGQLAAAINACDTNAVTTLLRRPREGGDPISWRPELPDPRALAEKLAAGYTPFLNAVKAGKRATEVFAAFEAYRILCSTRAGDYGSGRLNQHLLETLRRQLEVPSGVTWFAGRAVLITNNDYALRLFNGDVGIVLPDPSTGRLMAWFQAADGTMRAVSPTQLGNVEDALAITVHRAQGSEYERVAIVIEPELVRGLSRALVYTAVTRTRSAVDVHGPVVGPHLAAVGSGLSRSSPA